MLIKKVITVLFATVIILSCKEKKGTEQHNQKNQPTEVTSNNSATGKQNYAISWKWTTDNKILVEENLVTIADEVNKLWKEGVIVDAYYNSNAIIDKFEYFPNVFFFLKATSSTEVKNILNMLTLVKKGIASYKIHPVGLKWLDRDHEKIKDKGLTNSYAAVWTSDNWENTTDDLTKSQADAILKLWNNGTIENVYFDIEGTQKANDKTDFVFFINTNTEKEAQELCEDLPFAKKNIATYELYPVGVFWLGDFEEFNKE